ncbi:MAG TPA: protein kinase [Nitriliruptoraceae bacterium]|nr:protein kinase [Nitriliruptoraceae bacterium]
MSDKTASPGSGDRTTTPVPDDPAQPGVDADAAPVGVAPADGTSPMTDAVADTAATSGSTGTTNVAETTATADTADTADAADAVDAADTAGRSAWPPIRRLGDGGRYHLEEPIAAGGAATVWRAYDAHLGRSVALKILHPHLVADADTVRRFERESRNAARLHHPNATRIFDSGRVNDVVYLVMEYVDGPTLKTLMATHGAFERPRHVAAIGQQVASALAEAHQQGLIHRDIKPANILFTTDGVVKVADFGIAKALSGSTSDLTAEGSTVGTATYIAPEQYMGAQVDARADIYALGTVLYECLTGRPAFFGDTPTATAAARLTREVVPPRTVRADVDRRLDDVVVRSTRRDPNDRYDDVGAVQAALLAVLKGRDPQALTEELLEAEPPDAPSVANVPEVDPDAATDPNMSVSGSRGGRFRVPAAWAFLAGVLLTAVIAFWGGADDPPETIPEAGTVEIVAGSDFDPDGDQAENTGQVPLAFDNNLNTSWTTESYQAPEDRPFNDRKAGVGLYVELVDVATIDEVVVRAGEPGLSFDVYVSESLPDPIDGLVGWRIPVAQVEDAATIVEVPFEEPVRGRYVLLWFTQLPQVEPGLQRGRVVEVQVHGTVEPAPETPS